MNKPARLQRGDAIGIIAPASGIKDENRLLNGVGILQSLGYETIIGQSCHERNGFLSGSDELRAHDLISFFSDKNIKAIFCLRGGYGSVRIVDKLDYELIRNNPKVFMGYSDITYLNFSIFKKCNLVTFHGPMVASDIADFDIFTIDNFINCLEGKLRSHSFQLHPLVDGCCSGRIFGGNLSILCSNIGSEYNINWKNKILFLEDVNEEPYSIERKLYQLKLSGVFSKVSGVVLGQFTSCDSKDPDSQTVVEVFNEFFYNFNIPVYYGFMTGHGLHKITIPMGVKIEISESKLKFTEEGVQ